MQTFEGKKRALARFSDGNHRIMTQEEILQQATGVGVIYTEPRPLSFESEDDGVTYTYEGHAAPGSATSDPVWRIKRITTATGSWRYADGGNYSQIWDNRAALTYA